MTTIVDGKQLASDLRAKLHERVRELEGGPPRLAAVLVGEDPASQIYVRNKQRAAGKSGIESEAIRLPAETSQRELLERIAELNQDPSTHGILVQLPLPPQIDPVTVAAAIHPDKDVDCLHPTNGGLLVRNQARLRPCTPSGCVHILDAHGVEIQGARAVIVGRSEIVGKPLALMLLHRHATVTLCHSRTRDLPEVAREANILVAAVGVPELVQGDWIRPGAAVIDVGMNRLESGLVGDVAFEDARKRAGLITPVPGGVGPLTIAMLIENTLEAFQLQQGTNAA